LVAHPGDDGEASRMSVVKLRSGVVMVACAASAGIHSALVPDHLRASAAAGMAFLVAAVALGGLTVWLTRRPESRPALAGAGALLAGLIAAYAHATMTGLPLLHPSEEPVQALALATKAVELLGLVAAASALWRRLPRIHPQAEGAPR
jgi:hypothetical protein